MPSRWLLKLIADSLKLLPRNLTINSLSCFCMAGGNDEANSLKCTVVEASKAMHEAGLTTAALGNISALTCDRRIMAITPSGFDKSRLNSYDMIVMNLNGAVIDGRHKLSIEVPMHLEVCKSLEHVYAIVHTILRWRPPSGWPARIFIAIKILGKIEPICPVTRSSDSKPS